MPGAPQVFPGHGAQRQGVDRRDRQSVGISHQDGHAVVPTRAQPDSHGAGSGGVQLHAREGEGQDSPPHAHDTQHHAVQCGVEQGRVHGERLFPFLVAQADLREDLLAPGERGAQPLERGAVGEAQVGHALVEPGEVQFRRVRWRPFGQAFRWRLRGGGE